MITRKSITAFLATGAALGFYARFVEPRRLVLEECTVPIGTWPPSLDGLRIGVVGDIHLGIRRSRPWTSPALKAAVDAICGASVDLLVLIGDYGYMRWDADRLAGAIAMFTAPLRVAVLGNHDYARGQLRADDLRRGLERNGIVVLVNEVSTVDLRGEPVAIAGLGDAHAKRADIAATAEQLPNPRVPTILLSHSPGAVSEFPAGAFDLAFGGHTHGGQLAVPFLVPYIVRRFAQTRFNRGLYSVNGRPLFITKGIGMVGYRARFMARPGVGIITVKTAGEAQNPAR